MPRNFNEQIILNKAVEKAVNNGWDKGGDRNLIYSVQYPHQLIYDQDFAKALWGEKRRQDFQANHTMESGHEDCWYYCYPWEYHLQQMVINPDPIEYLGRNL